MNTRVLQKCLDELKKEKPDMSYIRGMLETLVEMGEEHIVNIDGGSTTPVSIGPPILTPPTMFSSKQISASDLTDEEREFHEKMLGGPVAAMRDDS